MPPETRKSAQESYLDERLRWGLTRRHWYFLIAIALSFAWGVAVFAVFTQGGVRGFRCIPAEHISPPAR